MVDLFSGLGGAHAAMKDRGWKVLTVDIEPWLKPDVVADVAHLPIVPTGVDLLWASPPCQEYSTKYQFGYWNPDAPEPDPTLWQATLDVIEALRPRWWVIENVRAAQKVWGKAPVHFGSRYLWTNIPMLGQPGTRPVKMGYQGNAKNREIYHNPRVPYAQSSKIEYSVSLAVCAAVENLTENAA